MTAREGIAGRFRDRIPCRNDSGILDPGTVDAGCQLDDRIDAYRNIRRGQHIETLSPVHAPVDKNGYAQQISHRKMRNKLHERRQQVADRVAEILQEQQIFNIHNLPLSISDCCHKQL